MLTLPEDNYPELKRAAPVLFGAEIQSAGVGVNRTGKVFGCAKRGCDVVNPDYMSYGAYGKGWCLHHLPLRIRLRRWLGEDV